MKSLREVLECPVCLTWPVKGPIKGCKNGHHICSTCEPNVTKCPICLEKIELQLQLQLEKIREFTPFPCKFALEGCKTEMMLKDLQIHENDCKHRLVNCPYCLCNTKVTLANLFRHCESEHFIIGGTTTRTRLVLIIR
jgi:hypothetical protein